MSSNLIKFVKGSILRIILFFLNAFINLALTPFIIRNLGDEMYGLWVLVGSFLGYYGLLDFGLNFAVKRYISRAVGANEKEEVNTTINTSLAMFVLIGIVSILFTLALIYFAPLVIKNITEISLFRITLLILGINVAIAFPCSIFEGILTGNMRYDIVSLVDLIKLIFRTTSTVLVLKLGGGIIALAIIGLTTEVGGYLLNFIFIKKLYKDILFSLKFFKRQKIWQLLKYSFFTFVSKIADQIRFNIDNLVIVITIGLNQITIYSIGFRLAQYFLDFIESALGMTFPLFSQYEGAQDYDSIRKNYVFLTKISCYLAIYVGSLLILFGKAFIERWVGKEYIGAYGVLVILLVAFMLDVMQPCRGILYGLSKHRYYAFFNCIEAIVNFILSIILVKKLGIYGVALGTAIPLIINKTFIQPTYLCRVINLSFKNLYMNTILPIAIFSISGLYIFWFIIKEWITPNYVVIVFWVTVETIIFLFIILTFGLSNLEKESLIKRIPKKIIKKFLLTNYL
ncbi:MAG: oligosaccharide flippase family protein [Candidatus Omnitrophica bacterium]|nr:oligosaccharide flippase family protein [Candidatus Omnitrophota bacterium]